MLANLPGIYLITDRKLLVGGQLLPVIEKLLQAGLRMLQLREKDLNAAELLPLAKQMRDLTRRYACRLLINDRVDLALAVAADGVHLGGHSMPVAEARQLLGPDKLIAVSTHQVEEILPAAKAGADFLTFGPVFHTPSKAAYGKPVGLDKLTQACRRSPVPVYALGGIKNDKIDAVKVAGACGIAMISALLTAPSPEFSFHELDKLMAGK